MNRTIDLLHGRIGASLAGLALPIMATSLVQMAYNLTDMAWIGRVGSQAVASVGAAGMYTWMSNGVIAMARMGGQVKTAHALGEGVQREAVCYGRGSLQIAVCLALLVAAISNGFAEPLIGFFGLESAATAADAVIYLRIACGLILFTFVGQTLTGLYTASGNSKTPFIANCIGMGANMILDPVLIFGIGPFPRLGVAGAAIATVTAQFLVSAVLVMRMVRDPVLGGMIRIWRKSGRGYLKTIAQIGAPASLQTMLYCGISMILTRFVASWGDAAIAVQRVGGQIESISWMTAEGFGSAVNAFVGQNFGAGNYRRVKKGYLTAALIVLCWGSFTTLLLVAGAGPLFSLFIREADVLPRGMDYLRIIGYGQMFMCIEMMTVGAMSGMGRTLHCSMISICLTSARIPLAVALGKTGLGLNGIWWALTISSIAKGITFFTAYMSMLGRLPSREGKAGREAAESDV